MNLMLFRPGFVASAITICGFAAAAGLSACAADPIQDEADVEEAAASEEELTANAARLVGAYHGGAGSSPRPPTFQGIVFKSDGTFFADLDTGIVCVTAPCPSQVRLEGKFTATKTYVRLNPKAVLPASGFFGRYRYTLVDGKLTLKRADLGTTWSNTLDKKVSYCEQPTDCEGQNLAVPRCIGRQTCSETTNLCGFQCGSFPPPPPASIWPANATKLVAESPGGGFVPPEPAGSECHMGQQKYTLNRATRSLAWEQCKYNSFGAPYRLDTGSKTITPYQLGKITQAMNAVTISSNEICGADKPILQIKVTTPAGEKTYTDSFYSCEGGTRTYVDNIDGVFSAIRNAID